MNNKSNFYIGFRVLKNYNDLGDCYPPRPIILIDLPNSSDHTQPLSIIVNYHFHYFNHCHVCYPYNYRYYDYCYQHYFYGPVLPEMNLLLHLNYKCVS